MKWFFCWCQDTDFRDDHNWKDLIRASVESAQKNTTLEPNFIYDGEKSEFTDELTSKGVNVIFHKLSFTKEIMQFKPDDSGWQAVARGAFLRFDIPLVTDSRDDFVLYTDADVIFMRNPDFLGYNPKFIAATSESIRGTKADFNSGVMLINLPFFRKIHADLIAFTTKNFDIALKFALDQGILKYYMKEDYLLLPEIYNWKPYWGINNEAFIVHWHGPKPETIGKLLNGKIETTHQGWMHLYKKDKNAYKFYLNRHMSVMKSIFGIKNVARGKNATQSSVSQWSTAPVPEIDASGAVNGVINGLQGFHTEIEDSPWWMVDLGGMFSISEINVFNRLDLPPDIPLRAARLAIEIGPDADHLAEVFRRETDEPFGGADGNPLIWAPPAPVTGRFVRIRLLTHNYLHLDQVEIYGEPATATPTDAPAPPMLE